MKVSEIQNVIVIKENMTRIFLSLLEYKRSSATMGGAVHKTACIIIKFRDTDTQGDYSAHVRTIIIIIMCTCAP